MKNWVVRMACCAAMLVTQLASAATEDWYTMWGIGLSDNQYPKEMEQLFDELEQFPGVARTEGAIDMFGFYWPLDQRRTVAGFVVNGSFERFEYRGGHYQFNQYLYALSGMHFFGEEVGDGFFIRGDAGIAKAIVDSSAGDSTSDNGSGLLLGVGYGLPVSYGSRVLFQLNFSARQIEGDTYSSTALTISGLW